MIAGRGRRRARTNQEPAAPLDERVQRQREQLFKVTSILDCCRYAAAPKMRPDNLEFMAAALEAVSDLVNGAAGELGAIVDALEMAAPKRRTHRRRPKRQLTMRGARGGLMPPTPP